MRPDITAGDDHCRVTQPDGTGGPAAQFEYHRHLFPYAEAGRRIPARSRVLEVGCGSGYGSRYLASLIPDITATDMSDQAIAFARQQYPGIQFVSAAATALPFAAAAFDAVISFQVIEHIGPVQDYLRELQRVLKPGGKLFLTTPNRRLRLLPFQRPWNPYHVREYRDRDLRELLRPYFPDAEVAGVMARPDLMAREISRVSRNPLRVIARVLPRLLPASVRPAERPAEAAGPEDFFMTDDTRGCLDLFAAAGRSN